MFKGYEVMIRHKWILKVRNTCASLAMECDSSAAIEGARLTPSEREALQGELHNIVEWIDKRLGFKV